MCRLLVAKKHNFRQFFTFGKLLYQPPFTDDGQIWYARADPWYTLTCQILSRSVYCVALCWWKTSIFAVFWILEWQTDRQTDKKTQRFGRPGGGWNPSSTKLSTVIEDLEHVLAPLKLGVWRSFAARGAENLTITRPRQLKTPITPYPLEQIQRNFNSCRILKRGRNSVNFL